MTVEQIKAEAKKRFGKDLTDEEAQALWEKGGELTDEELEGMSGGIGGYAHWGPCWLPKPMYFCECGLPLEDLPDGSRYCSNCRKTITYR